MSDMTDTCGCCEGVEPITPEPTANRPGLDALRTRIGTHATFLETMIARLGTMTIPVDDAGWSPPQLPPESPGPTTDDGRRTTDDKPTADRRPPTAEEPADEDKAEPTGVETSGDVAGVGAAVRPAAGSAPPAASAVASPAASAPTAPAPTPLRALTTRRRDDAAIALLDAWAIVGDVLTFYQERHANEGYLPTAVERRSVLELARLVGYRARPGLSASVYLSFTLEDSFTEETTIPAGTKAQSQPAAEGEKAQVFETAEAITARASWNRIRPRQSKPQGVVEQPPNLYFAGVGLNLLRGERLLVERSGQKPVLWRIGEVDEDRAANRTRIGLLDEKRDGARTMSFGLDNGRSMGLADLLRALPTALAELGDPEQETLDDAEALLVRALLLSMDALSDNDGQREAAASAHATLDELDALLDGLSLDPESPAAEVAQMMQQLARTLQRMLSEDEPPPAGTEFQALALQLAQQPSAEAIPPRTAHHLALDPRATFNVSSDLRLRLTASALGGAAPARAQLLSDLYKVTRTYGLGSANGQNGNAIPRAVGPAAQSAKVYRMRAAAPFGHNAPLQTNVVVRGKVTFSEWQMDDPLGNGKSADQPHHTRNLLYLDAEYEIVPGSWVYVERDGEPIVAAHPTTAQVTLAAYGLAGRSTRIDLEGEKWYELVNDREPPLSVARATRVYFSTEELTLTEEPLTEPVPKATTPNIIELNGVYEGLAPGRWVVVSGERIDLAGVTGVQASELVMIRSLAVISEDGGPRTQVTFANDLEYRYRRETAVLYANTVRATHGETINEVLGSGDARRRWPAFDLRKPPLTYLPAPIPSGAESTLTVRVNDVRWREADNHVLLGPADRAYVLERREEPEYDATTVIFGDGQNGARLPTGVENVTAVYRTGLGRPGNVAAGRIKQLATRPLGVKDVINALPAGGGADREGRDSARANAPLAVMALDRLVSVQDYADFARTYAGIGKAAAAELSDGRRSVVHLTIAGADDIPIPRTSDLYRNLQQALARAGDPWTAVTIDTRELALLVIIAGVRLHPDYLWSAVAPQIRARLYDLLSFGRRDLGQDVTAGEIIAAIHGVPGVVYADLDVLDALTDAEVTGDELETRLKDLGDAAARPTNRPQARVKVNMAKVDATRLSGISPAQLAYLDPRLPETLILKELT